MQKWQQINTFATEDGNTRDSVSSKGTEDEYICSYICATKPLRDFRISMIFIP